MKKIFVLMGKSASGKDTIYRDLIGELGPELDLLPIISYTTRPMRNGETDGKDYHFCTEETYLDFVHSDQYIEGRNYHTANGVWRYFTVDDGNIDYKNHNYLAIGDLSMYWDFQGYFFGKTEVVPIYIYVPDDGERLMRAIRREMWQKNQNYSELCRRFLADEEDFSEEKLNAIFSGQKYQSIITGSEVGMFPNLSHESLETSERIARYIRSQTK